MISIANDDELQNTFCENSNQEKNTILRFVIAENNDEAIEQFDMIS